MLDPGIDRTYQDNIKNSWHSKRHGSHDDVIGKGVGSS